MMTELIGAGVELPVGERLTFEDDGHGVDSHSVTDGVNRLLAIRALPK